MNTLAETKSETGVEADAGEHHDKPHYDDVNVPSVVTLGVISGLVTYIIIVFVQGLYYQWDASQIEIKEYGKPIAAAKAIELQKKSLTGYLQAKEGNQKSIPIDRAMLVVVDELRGKDKQEVHKKEGAAEEKSAANHAASATIKEEDAEEKASPESKQVDQPKSDAVEEKKTEGEVDGQPKEQVADDAVKADKTE